jgi:hypothetical protein
MKRVVLAVAVLVGACSKGPSEEECKGLLDHLVELEFKKAGAQASSDAMKAELAKQKTAVSEAKATEFVETCTKKTSKARVKCALEANDLDKDVAKCDDAK